MLPANIDNELLIAVVEARLILCQAKHKEHKNRMKKNVLWLEVAAIVLPGVLNAAFLSAVAHSCFVLSVEKMAAMVNDTKLLIAAVEQRPALWMASHRQHNDKYVKAALWREVAAAVMPGLGFEGHRAIIPAVRQAQQARCRGLQANQWGGASKPSC
ncbi:hypothetical protein HPB49_018626 [Dermacentor silvarum]|uniref:Uncharacterized protein n=1 Tax=Dermacentor silvarum TaxID=543639 RepID=A0ACB8D7F1_DERSI|nr:hypothetical protein HPB49_018626 [Dermacentor silvarum]